MSYTRNLIPLRDENTTARVVLERTIDKIDDIQSVVVIIKWRDKGCSFDVDWSNQKRHDLTMAKAMLDHLVQQELFGDE